MPYTIGNAPNYLAWPGGGTRGDRPPSTLVDGVTLGARAPSYPYPTAGSSTRKGRVYWTELAISDTRKGRVYWTELSVP